MITYQRSQARTVAVIAAGVAVLGGLAYWFMFSGSSDQREGVVLSASSPMDRMVQYIMYTKAFSADRTLCVPSVGSLYEISAV